MIDVKISEDLTISVYDSIKELPIEISKKQQMYAMQEAGIGNTIADWDERMAVALAYIEGGKTNEGLQELRNIRLTIFSALNEIDFKSLVFGVMVAKENGEAVTDIGENAVMERMIRYGHEGLTTGMVEDVLEDLKKNLTQND